MPDDFVEKDFDEPDGREDERNFRVWPENWDAAQIFLLCSQSFDVVAGNAGVFYLGIKISEIVKAMHLMKIPRAKQVDVARDVSYMAAKAAGAMNR